MKQSEIDSVLNGDVLHCTSDRLLSRIIRFFTRSKKTSHTALVVVLEGETFIVDSQYDGTRLRCIDEWNKDYNYRVVITRPQGEKRSVLENSPLIRQVKPYLNTKYGYFDLIRHVVMYYTGIWLGGKRQDRHLTCSEFVMRLFGVKDAYKMSPMDCYVWCLENGFVILKGKQNE